MFDLRRKIDAYCYRHPNFGIPNLMRYITIANVVFWILGVIYRPFLSAIMFSPEMIFTRLITGRARLSGGGGIS